MARFLLDYEYNIILMALENKHNLLSDSGYFERVRELQKMQDLTGQEAWQAVEDELKSTYGLARFLDYITFRQGKTRWYIRLRRRVLLKRITFYCFER